MAAILPIALAATAVLNAISGAVQGHRANKLRQRALALSEEDFRAREPARKAALERLLGPMPQMRDLSAGFQDPGNPFAVNRQAAPIVNPVPQAAMVQRAENTIPPHVLNLILGNQALARRF